MKRLIIIICLTSIACNFCHSQNPYADCDKRSQAIYNNKLELLKEKNKVINQIMMGEFCSKCNLCKDDFPSPSAFYEHVKEVQGVVTYQQKMVAKQEKEKIYSKKFDDLNKELASNRKRCDEMFSNWEKQRQEEIVQKTNEMKQNIPKRPLPNVQDRYSSKINNVSSTNLPLLKNQVIGITQPDKYKEKDYKSMNVEPLDVPSSNGVAGNNILHINNEEKLGIKKYNDLNENNQQVHDLEKSLTNKDIENNTKLNLEKLNIELPKESNNMVDSKQDSYFYKVIENVDNGIDNIKKAGKEVLKEYGLDYDEGNIKSLTSEDSKKSSINSVKISYIDELSSAASSFFRPITEGAKDIVKNASIENLGFSDVAEKVKGYTGVINKVKSAGDIFDRLGDDVIPKISDPNNKEKPIETGKAFDNFLGTQGAVENTYKYGLDE